VRSLGLCIFLLSAFTFNGSVSMWPEAGLLLAAFLTGVALMFVQRHLLTGPGKRKERDIAGDQAVETRKSSDQALRRIQEAISKKGELTVDELSEIILSDESSLDPRGESLRARLREMDSRIAAVIEEMNKQSSPDRKAASSPQ